MNISSRTFLFFSFVLLQGGPKPIVTSPRTPLSPRPDVLLKCVLWTEDLKDTFASLNQSQMERNKERISIQDKKVFKDPAGTIIKDGGEVLFLKSETTIQCCCALIFGAGSFDLKYVAFKEGLDDQKKEELLGQIVIEASQYATKKGVDQLFALFSGSRADAEKRWGIHGFSFNGVGKAPDFAVIMQKLLK